MQSEEAATLVSHQFHHLLTLGSLNSFDSNYPVIMLVDIASSRRHNRIAATSNSPAGSLPRGGVRLAVVPTA